MKEHQYFVNIWHNALGHGTATLWSGTNESEWYKQGAKAIRDYNTPARRVRVVHSDERTVISIATEDGAEAWRMFPVFAKCEIGIPRRFLDELEALKAEERDAREKKFREEMQKL